MVIPGLTTSLRAAVQTTRCFSIARTSRSRLSLLFYRQRRLTGKRRSQVQAEARSLANRLPFEVSRRPRLLRGGHRESGHRNLSAKTCSRIVEDRIAIAHEELPPVVQRVGRPDCLE